MNTENLIKNLAQTATPVQPIASPVSRFVRWLLAAVFCVGVGTALLGLRQDLTMAMKNNFFSVQIFVLIGLTIFSALSAFILSVPDKNRPWLMRLPMTTMFLWFAFIIWSFWLHDNMQKSTGIGTLCIRDIALLALIPGLLLFVMLKQAASLKPSLVGFFAMLGVLALGALGTLFICRNDSPLHSLLWHYLPVLCIGGTGIFLGRVFLRWQ